MQYCEPNTGVYSQCGVFFFTRKLTFHFMQEYRITEVPPRKWRLYKYLRHRKHPEGNVTVTENLQEEMVLS